MSKSSAAWKPRITCPQEDLRAGITSFERPLASLREPIENGSQYGAKEFWCYTIKFSGDKFLYTAMLHKGVKFASEEAIRGALTPNTSVGEHGAMGNGGSLSPLLLVSRVSQYKYYIYSKLGQNSSAILGASISKDREVVIHDHDEELLEEIRKIIGPEFDDFEVGYFARFVSKKQEGFHTAQLMTSLIDFCPRRLNEGAKVHYTEGRMVLSKDMTWPDEKQKDWRNYREVPTPSEYDGLFMDEKGVYKFTATDCRLKGPNNQVVVFDAEVEVRLYPGIHARDKRSDSPTGRYSYIGLRGGEAKHRWLARPEYNTFITAPWYRDEDTTLKRVADDPFFVGKQLTKIAPFLNLKWTDSAVKFNDPYVGQEPVGKGLPEYEYVDKLREDKKSWLVRRPFAKVFVRLLKPKKFFADGEAVADFNESDVRPIFGGLNEMFLANSSQKPMKVIEAVFDAVAKDTLTNGEEIVRLRNRCDKLWPFDEKDLVDLPDDIVDSGNRLRFLEETSKPISTIKPGKALTGMLQHYHSQAEVEWDWQFQEAPVKFGNTLTHVGDGFWTLKIGKLRRLKDDCKPPQNTEEFEKNTVVCTVQQFIDAASNQTWPKAAIWFIHDGEVYSLITKVVLPKRPPKGVKGTGGGTPEGEEEGTGPGPDDHTQQKTVKFAAFDPPEAYIRVVGNNVQLNTANEHNMIQWRRGLLSESWQFGQWRQIRHRGRLAKDTVCSALTMHIQDKGIADVWANDVEHYLINQLVAPLFESREVQKKMQEVRGKLGCDSGAPKGTD